MQQKKPKLSANQKIISKFAPDIYRIPIVQAVKQHKTIIN